MWVCVCFVLLSFVSLLSSFAEEQRCVCRENVPCVHSKRFRVCRLRRIVCFQLARTLEVGIKLGVISEMDVD